MIPRERLTRQNRGEGRGGRENTPAHSHCLFGERPYTGYTGGALLGAVSDVSIASCQSRSHDRSHTLIHPDFEKFDFAVEEQWEQKQAVITVFSRRDSLASSFSFLV